MNIDKKNRSEFDKKIIELFMPEKKCPYCRSGEFDNNHIERCKLKSPLISVIIPSRAGEEITSLESLKKQTYAKLEIIIEYDEKMEGASVVRNRGARKANGKYFFFCDNDLILNPNCIADLYHALLKSKDAKWAFGKFYIDENLFNGEGDKDIPKDKYSVEWVNYFHGMSTMSLIDSSINPIFDENMKRFNDWDLWLNLNRQGYLPVFCDKILFTTKNRRNGISKNSHDDIKKWKNKLYAKYEVDVEGEIFRLNNLLAQVNREIILMKESKFWKLRNKYVYIKEGIKFLLLHPEKFVIKYWNKLFGKK